jgi:hypothetical protein
VSPAIGDERVCNQPARAIRIRPLTHARAHERLATHSAVWRRAGGRLHSRDDAHAQKDGRSASDAALLRSQGAGLLVATKGLADS